MPLHTTFSKLASEAMQCHILLEEVVTKARLGSKVGDPDPTPQGIPRYPRETNSVRIELTGSAASGMQRKGQEMSGRKRHWPLGLLVCMEGKIAEEGF